MEDMVTSTPSKLLSILRNNSLLISKFKPKIRIVHIFAPEIIKTDVANFRELVQSLTGKPKAEKKGKPKKTEKLPCISMIHDHVNKTMLFEDVTRSNEENEVIWGNGSSSGGNFFDGFIRELSESSHHHDMVMDVLDQVEDIHFSK